MNTNLNAKVEVVPFVKDMPKVLRTADLVVSRCGALTLAEIAACGKPSILIPFPASTHQHQEHNARAIEQAGAGLMILQSELTGLRLLQIIEMLSNKQEQMRSMAEQSWRLRKIHSTEVTVKECERLVMEN